MGSGFQQHRVRARQSFNFRSQDGMSSGNVHRPDAESRTCWDSTKIVSKCCPSYQVSRLPKSS